eukprot:231364-Chlamydomonas_euryale.AAC.1
MAVLPEPTVPTDAEVAAGAPKPLPDGNTRVQPYLDNTRKQQRDMAVQMMHVVTVGGRRRGRCGGTWEGVGPWVVH